MEVASRIDRSSEWAECLSIVAEQAERKTGDKETQEMDMFKEDAQEGAGCRRLEE